MTSLLEQFSNRKVLVCVLLGALTGAVIGLRGLDPHFIAGGGKWIRPDNDYVAYLVAWHYYIVDAWRLPLFDLPAMGYPEGGSVLFNDALPLTALPTKILYQLFGVQVNPFGWWIFLTYVLQGAMAARLVCAVGVRSLWACTAAAVLALLNIAFWSRMGHTALSGHFLLLWALALHFESLRRGRAKTLELSAVLALTLLVNSYLFAMVFAFELVTLLALFFRGQLAPRDARNAILGVAASVVLGVIAGYGVFLTNPATMKSQGFGLYSWNLVGLLLPPRGVFGFLSGVSRDATHGQYEGESFIGRGALLLLVLSVVFTPRVVLTHLRTYWVYVASLVAFAVYAASHLVYLSNVLLIAYPLPQAAIDLGNYFRATGRFIWPLAYSLMILPVAVIFRRWHPAAAVAATLVAVSIQVNDALPGMRWRRQMTMQPYEELIDTRRMESWLAGHDRLWQYPSWSCGGLEGSKRRWPGRESNRELQVQLVTARAGIPTNSVYTSRLLKDCPAELAWAANPQLEDGVFYLFAREAVAASPALTAIARSNACVTLEWGVACSRKWLRTAPAAGAGDASRPHER
jgi:hypothetical protein